MHLDFKDIKTLQDMVIIMTEMQAELKEVKALLLNQVDRNHLTVSDIAKEMGSVILPLKGGLTKDENTLLLGK